MKIVVTRTLKKIVKLTPQQDGSVEILAYRFLSRKKISQIVLQNIDWIARVVQKRVDKHCVTTDNYLNGSAMTNGFCEFSGEVIADFFSCKKVLLCGEIYDVIPSVGARSCIQNNALAISEKYFADKSLKARAVKSFLKKTCVGVLSQEVAKFGSGASFCPTKIMFKDLGRWCSCSDAEQCGVVLDFRCMQLPVALQKYVIAHTFCHFSHKGHDDTFYNSLSNYLPNYKDLQNNLRDFDFLFDVL